MQKQKQKKNQQQQQNRRRRRSRRLQFNKIILIANTFDWRLFPNKFSENVIKTNKAGPSERYCNQNSCKTHVFIYINMPGNYGDTELSLSANFLENKVSN